jgi:UDP-glucose 4-epimerase
MIVILTDPLTALRHHGRGFPVREVLNTTLSETEVPFHMSIVESRPGDAASVIANTDPNFRAPQLATGTFQSRRHYQD